MDAFDVFKGCKLNCEPSDAIKKACVKCNLSYKEARNQYMLWREVLRDEWNGRKSNIIEKYREDKIKEEKVKKEKVGNEVILRLINEGKTYKEISEIVKLEPQVVAHRHKIIVTSHYPKVKPDEELYSLILDELEKGTQHLDICKKFEIKFTQLQYFLRKLRRTKK